MKELISYLTEDWKIRVPIVILVALVTLTILWFTSIVLVFFNLNQGGIY